MPSGKILSHYCLSTRLTILSVQWYLFAIICVNRDGVVNLLGIIDGAGAAITTVFLSPLFVTLAADVLRFFYNFDIQFDGEVHQFFTGAFTHLTKCRLAVCADFV